MRITHQSMTLNEQPSHRFGTIRREWYRKWNSCLATVVCVLGFMLLFSIVMMNLMADEENNRTRPSTSTEDTPTNGSELTRETDQRNQMKIWKASGRCRVQYEIGDVQCDGLQGSEETEEILKPLLKILTAFESITMTLFDQGFPNDSMEPGWLKIDKKVSKLVIADGKLNVIQPFAFRDKIFAQMVSLTLSKLNIKILKTDMFNFLMDLKSLQIDTMPLSEVEKDILEPMQDSLENLSVNYANLNDPYNLTGCVNMRKLTNVNLSQNRFEHLQNYAFYGLHAVIQLNLMSSKIKSIGSKTFNNISKTLRQLTLSTNPLESLEECTFDDLLAHDGVEVFLYSNNWNCTCDLNWLKELENKFPKKLIGMYCQWPEHVRGAKFKDVEFCGEETAPTKISSYQTSHSSEDTISTITISTSSEETTSSVENPKTSTSSPSYSDETISATNPSSIWSSTETTASDEMTTSSSHSDEKTSALGTSSSWSSNEITTSDEMITSPTYPDEETSTMPIESENNNILTLKCTITSTVPSHELLVESAFDQDEDIPIDFKKKSTNFRVFEYEDGVVQFTFIGNHMSGTLLYFDSSLKLDSTLGAKDNDIGCHTNVNADFKIRNLKTDTTYTFCFVSRNELTISPFQCLGLYIQPLSQQRCWIINGKKKLVLGTSGGGLCLMFLLGSCLVYLLVHRFPGFFSCCRNRENKNQPVGAGDVVKSAYYVEPISRPTVYLGRRLSDSSIHSIRSYVSAVSPTTRELLTYRMDQMRSEWRTSSSSQVEISDIPPPLPPHPHKKSSAIET